MRVLPAYRDMGNCSAHYGRSGCRFSAIQAAKRGQSGNDGMTSQLVKTGLYVISGQGSNSVLRLSANGLILVDGKLPGNYDALRARVKKISDQPIRALILTDCDESRTGTNAKFVENGTPIVVQENAKQNLAACNFPAEAIAPAIVTYATRVPDTPGWSRSATDAFRQRP